MRSAEPSSSPASPRAVSDAATQRSAAPVAGPGEPRDVRQPVAVEPAAPPAARRAATARAPRAPRGGRASRPRRRRRRAPAAASAVAGPLRAPRAAARSAAPRPRARCPASTNSPSVEPTTSSASTSCDAARLAAAAGLLSSCARPGGHRAQRREPLAVLLLVGQPGHHRPDLAHDPLVHRPVRERERDERARGGTSPARQAVSATHAHAHRRLGERRDRPDPGRRRLAAQRLRAPVLETQAAHVALEQQQHARHRLALLAQQVARRGVERLGHLRPTPPAARRRGRRTGRSVRRSAGAVTVGRACAHAARYSWISDTAIEPSPTALATRLIERARTSPATNTPGTLVSSR